MLTIGKNNLEIWDLLVKVLSKEIQETDPLFLAWLQENKNNRKLYQSLKKGVLEDKECMPDKDEMFDKIAHVLSFTQKDIPFFKKTWLNYTAAIFLFSALGFVAYLTFSYKNLDKQVLDTNKTVNIFAPGAKEIYLLSPQGDTIDMSKPFEIEKKDGTVISNKAEGIVSIEKKKHEKELHAENHTIYVPRGRTYTLVLADGSRVYLNSETQLTFPTSFSDEQRMVMLTGEAFFEVKKNSKPFIVKTDDMQIEVLGTSFNINAYSDNSYTYTTLVDGIVEIHTDNAIHSHSLSPGENLNLDKSTHRITISQVNTELYTAWINGVFMFRNQPLTEIFGQLKRWYNFEIEYNDPNIPVMRFTGSAEKARPLKYLLDQIQSVTDVKYIINDDVIILY